MDLTASLDLMFLLLALALIPASKYLPTPPRDVQEPLTSPFLRVPGRSTQSTPSGTPVPSSGFNLDIPRIAITPPRPGLSHKRKSVSFSLSHMDELHQKGGRRRPPTPFVIAPASPYKPSPEPSPAQLIPASPALVQSKHSTDSMGVEKSWLMP